MRDHPMIRVYGTIPGQSEQHAVVAMRAGESLEDAIARGCAYILDASTPGFTYLENVWSDTADEYDYSQIDPLMDGQIPGGILTERSTR